MVGDEENTEFIGENMKKEEIYKKDQKENSKRAQINGIIYFGATLVFLCIIITLFWQIQKKRFHKKDAHLLVITQQEFQYFDQLSDITRIDNCQQNITLENENTLIFVENNELKDETKECLDIMKSQFSDILLIIYNATQESILQQQENNIHQYYISKQKLEIKNTDIQIFEGYQEEEQIEIVEQIINNIFK